MPSITDVAKQAGVSTATVSRTFNEPHLIHPETQRRVREAALRLNYLPRRFRMEDSRGKSAGRVSGAMGFQFFASHSTDMLLSNVFYANVLGGALAEASSSGAHLLIHATDHEALLQELPRMVEDRAIDGMLLVGRASGAVIEKFAKHVQHIVLVDNRDAASSYESILSDGFGGIRAATLSLIDRGHRRIAFLGAEPDVVTFQDRLHGFNCAHVERGLCVDNRMIIRPQSHLVSDRLLYEILVCKDRPTAIIGANDWYAIMAMRMCRSLKLRVPEDVSIIGFDDISMAEETNPPLSTVNVDKQLIGRIAIRRLIARMISGESDIQYSTGVCTLVPARLVLRESCRSLLGAKSEY